MGGVHWVRPPRSANELGCQANGGVRAGRAPPRSANDLEALLYSSYLFIHFILFICRNFFYILLVRCHLQGGKRYNGNCSL